MRFKSNIKKLIISLSIIGILSGCGGQTRQLSQEERVFMPRDRERMDRVKGGRGLLTDLFFRKSQDEQITTGTSDNYLWSASLQVLSNFPLSSIDNKSGLIITDWYSSEKKPSERFKITVLILSKKIEAGALKVKVHRQILKNSRWVNIDIENKKTSAIERKIISTAIDLKTEKS